MMERKKIGMSIKEKRNLKVTVAKRDRKKCTANPKYVPKINKSKRKSP